MSAEANAIVTVNAGSSSIKIAAFAVEPSSATPSRLVDISINNIGQPAAMIQISQPNAPTRTEKIEVSDHITALRFITERLTGFVSMDKILAVGHRLVHGGAIYTKSTPVARISDAQWELLTQLDPEHTPAARQLIAQFAKITPSAVQVACFDTTFFQDLPKVAKITPIPKKYYELGVRRYGFHGLSYTSLLDTFREKAGETAANGRVVLAHLGGGVSLTATKSGKPVDTTMGFTPTSGTIMSTRSGDLDPHIFGFLHYQTQMDIEEFERMVSFESGLLGVSGYSGDMHALLEIEAENQDAKTAVDLFVRDVKKSIGALTAVLGGLDSLIFAGGIGEKSAVLRARICQDLEHLGIEIDKTMNDQNDFLISSGSSDVGVHVIETDEARVIVTQTIELLNAEGRA